jgi:hypothetical protein
VVQALLAVGFAQSFGQAFADAGQQPGRHRRLVVHHPAQVAPRQPGADDGGLGHAGAPGAPSSRAISPISPLAQHGHHHRLLPAHHRGLHAHIAVQHQQHVGVLALLAFLQQHVPVFETAGPHVGHDAARIGFAQIGQHRWPAQQLGGLDHPGLIGGQELEGHGTTTNNRMQRKGSWSLAPSFLWENPPCATHSV